MLVQIFELTVNFWQGFLMIWFIQQVLHQKKAYRLLTTMSILLIGSLLSIDQLLLPAIPDYAFFLIPLVYAILTTEDKWFYAVLWATIETVTFIGTILLVGNSVAWLSGTGWQEMLEAAEPHVIYIVSANVALTFSAGLVAWLGRKQALISARASVIFVVLLILAFVVNECLYQVQIHANSSTPLVIAAIASFTSVVLMVVMYELMNKEAENKRQTEIALQTALLVQQHQEELRSMYATMLSSQHDLRHRIVAVESLLTLSNDYEQKQKALTMLRESPFLPEYITGNMAVDAILKAKSALMDRAGIEFKYSLYPLKSMPVPENDFCVMLSNLIDNAIEGVMRLPVGASSRAVQLTMTNTRDMFSILCINDYNPTTIKQRGERFISSKRNPQIHGFGTINMRATVEKYGGYIHFDTTATKFKVTLIIPDGENHA